MVRVALWEIKFALVLFICGTDLLPATNGQLRLPLLGRQRTCPPHSPLPVNDTYDLSQCRREVAAAKLLKDPEAEKRTAQIVIEHGYDLETHTVNSQGYILSMHRIPGGPKSPRGGRKPAVMLYHGLGSVGDAWFALPSNKNLPFKLVDAGYDVWIPNGRGSDMSQGHSTMDADDDIDYWDFSYHEMGVHDLPASVDLILKVTGNQKIFYIGHSQGGTIYLVGASEVPQLNDKIHASFLFAPAAYLGQAYISSFTALLRLLYTPLETVVYGLAKGRWEMRSPRGIFSFLGIEPVDVCSKRALQCDLCDTAFFNYFDFNPHQVNYTNTPNNLKLLNTANLKSYIHLGQNILACKFQKYDHGLLGNLRRYGSREPPSYPLRNIRAPLHIYYGEQDSFIPPPDIIRLANDINPAALRGVHRVPDDTFDHADFAIGKDADKLVYAGLINQMNNYLRQ